MSESTPKSLKRFPQSRRLLKHSDFEQVYKKGRRHFAAHITVFFLRREDRPGGLRVGFTVGKVLGGSVQRNRIRRRLREAVRLHGFRAGLAADVVINPKGSLLTADFGELQQEVAKAFQAIEKATKSV
jgi:ribonuclease P protein component